MDFGRSVELIVIMFVVLLICAVVHGARGFFDLSDLEDPLSVFWNHKNTLLQDKVVTCDANLRDGSVVQGLCENKPQCLLARGLPLGRSNCPGFFSTCCVYSRTCGKSTKSREAYFTSTSDVINHQECNYNIQLASENVCQIRVDFEKFILEEPTPDSITTPTSYACQIDRFTVASYESTIPTLCGYNTGQHIYIPVHETSNAITLNILLSSRSRSGYVTPDWRIKIRQLECPSIKTLADKFKNYQAAKDFPFLAPPYALQYYPQRTGYIKSFGFNDQTSSPSHYTSNQKYAIAFKRTRTTCGIRFSIDKFNVPTAATDPERSDYLFIPGLEQTVGTTTVDGSKITSTSALEETDLGIATPPGPLYIYFSSGDSNTARNSDSPEGFKLKYELVSAC